MLSPQTLVKTAEVMGTVATIQVVYLGPPNPDLAQFEIAYFVAGLRADQAIFTTFEESSAINRIRRGELELDDAPAVVREVEQACRLAKAATYGRFDAWFRGWFDPTGYVKGWSTERHFRSHLAPLLKQPQIIAVGVNVGGDMQVKTQPGAEWEWRTGIADPFDKTKIIAKFNLRNGAVATSGPAERGAHIFDPHTGLPAATMDGGLGIADSEGNQIVSATVIADSLTLADIWATTAVVAGFNDLSWINNAPTRSGLIVSQQGRTRRWAGEAEVL